jgi:hypothetical protein
MKVTLPSLGETGAPIQNEMVIDEPNPRVAVEVESTILGPSLSESTVSPTTQATTILAGQTQTQLLVAAQQLALPNLSLESDNMEPDQISGHNAKLSPKKKINKRWKRSTREVKQKQLPVLLSNPLQRILEISGSPRKSPKKNVSPQCRDKGSVVICKKKSPQKKSMATVRSPKKSDSELVTDLPAGIKGCKRKVGFDSMAEIVRSTKKGKCAMYTSDPPQSAEPEEQARREQ